MDLWDKKSQAGFPASPTLILTSEFIMSISKCIVRLKDCHDTEHSVEVRCFFRLSQLRSRTTIFNDAQLTRQIAWLVTKHGVVQSLFHRFVDERTRCNPTTATKIQTNRPVPRTLNSLTMNYFGPHFSNPPGALKRFVLVFRGGVGRNIRWLASKNVSLPMRINRKPRKLCLAQHPSQGNL